MKRSAKEEAKLDRWYARAVDILDGRANGMGVPALRALASRGHIHAKSYLANRMLDPLTADYDPGRGLLLERAIARRDVWGLYVQNLSTSYRNRRNMAGYRYWLRGAEWFGDADVAAERQRFQTRFPYAVMKRFGRYRPYRKKLDG